MLRNLALRVYAIRAACNVISISVYGTLHVGQRGTSGARAFLGIHSSDKQLRVMSRRKHSVNTDIRTITVLVTGDPSGDSR